MRQSPSKHVLFRRPAGYTLLELVLASASAAVLMGGLAWSLEIASKSLKVGTGSLAETRTAHQLLATLHRDLQTALTLSELTETSVTMSVPDRDGDLVPETIRYAWSGTELTQVYNCGTVTTLATNVQSFSLVGLSRLMEGISTQPIVLFVSGQAPNGAGGLATPSALEQLRIDLMDEWSFDVAVLSQQAAQSEFDAELANTNVVYVSGEANGATIGTKLNTATLGVVTESFANAEQLGFYSSLSASSLSSTTIEITNASHYITGEFTTGTLAVASASQDMKSTTSSFAPDAIRLANASVDPTMLILDQGDELASGATAAGRRCQLPWGESSFDATALNTDGQTLMRRAIEWASGAGEDTATPGVLYQEFTEAMLSTNETNITINLPPGTSEGNLLIAVIATDGNLSDTMSAPTGWNPIILIHQNDRVTLGVWWKLATASESSSYNFTWTGYQQAYGWIMRFTGHDPTNPINDWSSFGDTSNLPEAKKVTTTVPDTLILRLGGFDDDDIIATDDSGMAGHTTITMDRSTTGNNGTTSGGAAYEMHSTVGDTLDAPFTLSASEEYVTVTIAIAPDPNP